MSTRRSDTHGGFVTWMLVLLAIAGLALNLFLLSRHFGSGGIAGCGGGNCEEVLASRWAFVFRIPVTVFGTIAYLMLLLSLRSGFESCRAPAIGLITGGALWFVFVQTVILHRFCPWCLAAHLIAFSICTLWLIGMIRTDQPAAAFFRAGRWLLMGALAIGLAQIYGPEPVTHRLANDKSTKSPERDAAQRELDELPMLGPASAKHVMIEYFDYQCAACRTMAGHLSALLARHPEDLAVRLAPVPMDRQCNSHVPAASEYPGSCEIAKTAIAVWLESPARFEEFHRRLLADPSPESARRLALEIMNSGRLTELMSDRKVMGIIGGNVSDWRKLSLQNPKLPKLLVRPGRMLHGLPSSEASFIEVMERELGL